MPNWLLPENTADVLPAEARKIEELRRRLLDCFRSYGYEMVIPPMLEYIESLMTGAGQDLDLRTFKLVDQLSGRTMGVRADMTTQVARIDAHLLNRTSVTRLCYTGSILHTRPNGLFANREPLQIGAEIYGHAGLEADIEIQDLLIKSLQLANVQRFRLDLCHVGVLRAILERDAAARADEVTLHGLLEAKDTPALQVISQGYDGEVRQALLKLSNLYGDVSIIETAREVLPNWDGIVQALNDLQQLAHAAQREHGIDVTIDLADLRGYHYHSGVMMSAYSSTLPNAIARGGRYDHVGEAFGRARPATGFSLDLRELAGSLPLAQRTNAIRAPWGSDPKLQELIASLRQDGEIVIQSFPGHEKDLDEFDCDRAIVFESDKWMIKNGG